MICEERVIQPRDMFRFVERRASCRARITELGTLHDVKTERDPPLTLEERMWQREYRKRQRRAA